MSITKSLKIILNSNKIVILNNIDEFTSGYQYIYIRHTDGKTASFNRCEVKDVLRLLPNGREMRVFLKKPKVAKHLI